MTGKSRFDKLLEPYHIGNVRVRNRMIKTAADTGFADNSYVTEKQKAFYEALARGGVGLIIVEPCPIRYPFEPALLRIDDDKYLPKLSELTQVIHKHGCPVFLQLLHPGPWLAENPSTRDVDDSVSASSLTESELPGPAFTVPRELTIEEIEEFVDKFAGSAERAKKAGFDGVEINAATCHLVNSFLSRVWNKRKDIYGCESLENRSRFAVEIIREIKKRLGHDFPVDIIINGAEFGVDKGTTLEESKGFAKILQDAGADAIHVRAEGYGDYSALDGPFPELCFFPEPPKIQPRELDWSHKGAGLMANLASEIKKVVSIPVITVGRLDPILGEKIIQQGKADFIGLTRRLMADPDLPNKVASGRLEDIAPCTACLECVSLLGSGKNVQCRVNATLGNEKEFYTLEKAKKKKKVVVVGGGPAGMEAARVAAIRGHQVLLYEKEHKLGGLLPMAALVKGTETEDLLPLVSYLKTQITKLGVKVRLGKEFTPTLIDEIKPDVVILSAGGIPSVLEIPGINQRNVVKSSDLHNKLKMYLRFLNPKALRWLTRFWMPLGKKVVIIGGAIQGCEVAELLVMRGRKVTIVDTAETLGEGVVEMKKPLLLKWLSDKGVVMMTNVKYEKITDKGLSVTTKEGNQQTIEADTVVIAIPFRQNIELIKAIEGKVSKIYSIGDCSEPRRIIDAIADAYRVARAI